MKSGINSLGNNSSEREKKPAKPYFDEAGYLIRELEISLTNVCNLTCVGCGFAVPNQALPFDSQGVRHHLNSLEILGAAGVRVKRIVLVGGEAALVEGLAEFILQLRKINVCDEIELVTNGLYPRGINANILKELDRFVVSDYVYDDEFEGLWLHYLKLSGFEGECYFRRKDFWDDLMGDRSNDPVVVEQHWKTCFYRSYDVTLERGRLFSCSRIAKKLQDHQGLLLTGYLSAEDVRSYLMSVKPKESCYSCPTVGASSNIPVAVQLDSDIDKILVKAKKYLRLQVL